MIMFVVCTANAMSQDTVREGDPWYLFWPHPEPVSFSVEAGISVGQYITRFVGNAKDTIDVYGVAIPMKGRMPYEEERVVRPLVMCPTAVLYHQIFGGNPPTVTFVDSANVHGLLKEGRFKFELADGTSRVTKCYEFYFDTPHRFVSPADSFYVGHLWPESRLVVYRDWYVGVWDPTLVNEDWMRHVGTLPNMQGAKLWYVSSSGGGEYPSLLNSTTPAWGAVFPIIGLRCTAPILKLVGHGGDSVTVGWWQAEGGEAYELSLGTYGSDPDTGLLVTPADSVHTFTGLQSDTLYSIWVRKACRYTTEGYDTLVWSDWSRPLVCRSSVGIEEVYGGEGLHVAAQDGCVAVQGLASGERAEVYDMKGCRVATLAADGRTVPLPQGVYLVRTTAGRARKAVLTR